MFRELVVRFLRKAGVRGWSSASSASGSTTTTTSVSEGVFSPKKPHHRRRYKYKAMATLETLHLDNLALKSLPLDKETENFVRQVSGACFSRVEPTPVDNPTMVAFSASAMELLDLPLGEMERPEAVQYFCGNKLLKGSETAAHCYCGHQFGHFSGQLGDGAAMYLGEVVNRKSERWEIQLKGAGLTPYSRTADGRKVLRSSIREFLCSEAMHFLGIPTTRAGTCITSDSKVIRDIFYSGNPIAERCSVVLRIAPTFIRFGSFEIFKDTDAVTGRRGPSHGRTDILRDLLDYTVSTFYPQIWATHGSDRQTAYVEFYKEVVKRTARLVAEWQCVGFCHGVLNTDNMSIVGVTIDYGPYGFMDAFDPGYVCNGSDDGGRYTYENQPEICQWNCGKLGEAIQEAVPLSETRPLLEGFMEEYNRHYMEILQKKLGLLQKEKDSDKELIESLLETMHKTGADFTNTFRALSSLPLPTGEHWKGRQSELLTYLLSQCSTVAERKAALSKPKMDPRQLQMFLMIAQSNPDLLAQLGAAQSRILGELQRREKLKDIQEVTEADQRLANEELWGAWLGRYTTRLADEMEGITDLETLNSRRRSVMDSTNPRLVLRNYIAQNAIAAAEKGDYSEVRRVLQALERPFDGGSSNERLVEASSTTGQGTSEEEDVRGVNQMSCSLEGRDDVSFDSKPPEWSRELRVT